MIIFVKVITNAKKNEITSYQNNILKIKINAIREKNKANLELINFLSKTFKIPKSKIEIISGKTSSIKKIKIDTDEKKINNFLLKYSLF
jgi:hypothetical protein